MVYQDSTVRGSSVVLKEEESCDQKETGFDFAFVDGVADYVEKLVEGMGIGDPGARPCSMAEPAVRPNHYGRLPRFLSATA